MGILSANDIYNDDVCFRIFYISVYGKLSFGQIRSFFFELILLRVICPSCTFQVCVALSTRCLRLTNTPLHKTFIPGCFSSVIKWRLQNSSQDV